MQTEDQTRIDKMQRIRGLTDAIERVQAEIYHKPSAERAQCLQRLKRDRADLLATMPLTLVS